MGPPGSGKTTYCWGAYQYLNAVGRYRKLARHDHRHISDRFYRKVAVVNLDPANDHIPYPCAINVADLITLDDTMRELGLGPNGGIMFCLEYLLENIDWLTERLEKLQGKRI